MQSARRILELERFDRDRIERAARIYASNRDAGLALGMAPSSFGRLCRRFGIETPQARRKRGGRGYLSGDGGE